MQRSRYRRYPPNKVGSLFIFTTDAKASKASLISERKPRGSVLGLHTGQPVYRILIVEDNPDNRAVLTEILSITGLEVRIAVNGKEGVDQPDLIFMDIQMPVMGGYEATKIIKEQREAPIIAITAAAFEHERSAMHASGFDDLIIKPLRTENIFEILEKHIQAKFIYAEIDTTISEKSVQLTTTDLINLPEELLKRLQQAIIEANRAQVYAIIEEIALSDKILANSLSALVDDFRFDILVELIADGESE